MRLRIEEGQSESEVLSAESRLLSGDPGPITEEELAFGGNVGFPMERRPAEYRREMVKLTDESLADVRRELQELGLNQLMEDYEMTDKQKEVVELLVYTCRDIFITNPAEMPTTDLVIHTIPTYSNAKLVRTKEIVYSQKEIQW